MAQTRLGAWEGWRAARLRQRLAAAIGVVAVAVGLVYLPARVRHVDGEVASFAELSPQGRVLREANAVGVDTGIYLLAKRLIPAGSTYYMATGPGVQVESPNTLAGVGPFGILFLLPRMPVNDPHDAGWIVSYGGDVHALGVPIARVWTYKPGMQVAEVRR